MTRFTTLFASAAIVAVAGIALAGGHGGNPAVSARKAHMGLNGFNLGVLGAMAKGEAEYNADIATGAANNLVALVNMDQMSYWPAGSDNGALGDETRALPALWENYPDVMEKVGAVKAAAENLAAVAGNGQEGLGAAIGALGGACNECHKAYRAPSK